MIDTVNEVFKVFCQVAQTSGRKAKIELLRTVAGERMKEIVMATYSPYRNYYVTVAGPTELKTQAIYSSIWAMNPSADSSWKAFRFVLDRLNGRTWTGNRAKIAVEEILRGNSEQRQFWFRRILNRDLKIGVGPDTFLKEFYPGLFPMMNVMLCKVYDGGDLEKEWYCQPKLDGLRCVIVVDDVGRCVALSRNNKPLHNLQHIFEELLRDGRRGYVLDGELFGVDWNTSISIAQTEDPHPDARKLKFHAFDRIPLDIWNCEGRTPPLRTRIAASIPSWGPNPQYVMDVPFEMVRTEKEIADAMARHIEQGFEGSVLKDPDSSYEFKRSGKWLKVKPDHEDDFKIVGFEEGDGKYQGKLGALLVQGTIGTVGIATRVGSGFSDAQRTDYWAKRGLLSGTMVQVKYQEIAERTENGPKGDVRALRFPVFMRLRTDK